LSILAAAALLSPALALLMFLAVEIVIGLLVDVGAPALLAVVAAGAGGCWCFASCGVGESSSQSRHKEVR